MGTENESDVDVTAVTFEPNAREVGLAREYVQSEGAVVTIADVARLLAAYRAELMKPENVLAEAERLLREARIPEVYFRKGYVDTLEGDSGGTMFAAYANAMASQADKLKR